MDIPPKYHKSLKSMNKGYFWNLLGKAVFYRNNANSKISLSGAMQNEELPVTAKIKSAGGKVIEH